MKLSSFLIGMLGVALAVSVATLAFGGSLLLSVAMCAATLVVAQLLYAVLLVTMAKLPESGKRVSWTEGGAQGVFAHQGDLAESKVKRTVGKKA